MKAKLCEGCEYSEAAGKSNYQHCREQGCDEFIEEVEDIEDIEDIDVGDTN